MNTYPDIDALSQALEEHFRKTDMPEIVRCRTAAGGYEFGPPETVPYAVREPDAYVGDDGIAYWSATNARFGESLITDGFEVVSMHSSEFPSAAFVKNHLADLDAGPITLGCVIVSFADDSDPEWAWVVSL